MALTWSEERRPDSSCTYNYVVAESPLGQVRIEWKGWKDNSSPTCELPWGEFVLGIDLDDTKEAVQAAWDRKAAQVAAFNR